MSDEGRSKVQLQDNFLRNLTQLCLFIFTAVGVGNWP